jgi:general secretion pathway protein D
MKKHISAKTFKRPMAWRRWSAAMVVLCAVAVTAQVRPVYAASPAADEAVLNFVGADIESVIKAIGHYTNTTFIIDPRVKGTITLVSEKPVSKTHAFGLLTSALRLQGFSVVTGESFSKVVPEADAKLQAGPIQVSTIKGDQIATQIFQLNYESSANLVTVLRPLISPNNTINANPGNNTLIITDYADNLTRLGKIIAALDAPGERDLDIVPIRHAIASDIAVMANRLMEPVAGMPGGATGRVSLLADSRTNSVIVRAPNLARANLAKSLIARLDQPTALPGNVHVVYLRNADATKLAQTLRAVVSMDTSTPVAAGSSVSSGAPGSAPPATPSAAPSQTQGATGSAGFIQADSSTNTLIITASEPVYRNLRAVIDQLDARRAQVYVESLIVEVSADKVADFGIQWMGLSGDSNSNYRVGGGTSFVTLTNNNLLTLAAGKGQALPGAGFSLGIFRQINGQLGLGALAHALESDANANILSIPNLITLDNEEAKIIVGQNVPFITGQYTTPASAGSAGVNPFQTVERKDIGLSLRVRPQISEGGTVKMSIYQETSSVFDSTNSAGIITNKRSIETNVLVDDGEIIVLGGLVEDAVNDSEEKVRGLGDIPVFGNLFKYQTRKRSKKNLMVFLRPTVIRNNEQSVNVAADRYEFIRNAEVKGQVPKTILLPEMPAPTLPPLEKGRPGGNTLVNPDPALRNSPRTASPESVTAPK